MDIEKITNSSIAVSIMDEYKTTIKYIIFFVTFGIGLWILYVTGSISILYLMGSFTVCILVYTILVKVYTALIINPAYDKAARQEMIKFNKAIVRAAKKYVYSSLNSPQLISMISNIKEQSPILRVD